MRRSSEPNLTQDQLSVQLSGFRPSPFVIRILTFCLLGALAFTIGFSSKFPTSARAGSKSTGPDQSRPEKYGRLPLYFIENIGQIRGGSEFYLQGSDKTIFFSRQGLTFAFIDQASRWSLKLDFVNPSSEMRLEGSGESDAVFSYFNGPATSWKSRARSFSRITYRNIWPGIDLEYSGTVQRMKYSFRVAPGADPSMIRLAYRGATRIETNSKGELEVATPAGAFHDESPVSFQRSPYKTQNIATSYSLDRKGDVSIYSFNVARYDRTRELIIDPAVLIYSGFIGGSGDDAAYAIAVDSAKNAYVTGETSSTQTNFPVVAGPDLTYNGGSSDAFIAKVNAAGTALVYCGFIGGSQSDKGRAVAVDSGGNAYVTGETFSDQTTFPVLTGPGLTGNAGPDVFVTKVNPAGTGLVYSGFIAGASRDFATGIAVDSGGNAYVTGYTDSTQASFPVVAGPDLTHNGGIDGFVAKVNPSGSGLIFAGYVGGVGDDYARAIAVDPSFNVYITGDTASTETSFPLVTGPDLTYNLGPTDAFVVKVNANGGGLGYSGYVGGPGSDAGYGIAVDSAGNAYVTGETNATGFPVVGGPDASFNGATDTFVTKVNAAGSALVYSGFIGGTGIDRGFGIAVDTAGNAYIAGETSSFQTSFPVVGGPKLVSNGLLDAFVARVNPAGSLLVYAGYIGGPGNDYGRAVALDSDGNAYFAGYTESTTGFPAVAGPDLSYNGGFIDAWVAKIERQPDTVPPVIAVTGGIVRSRGQSGTATLAFLSDVDTRPENIGVALSNVPPAITVANLSNVNGQVAANVSAPCGTALGRYTFTLEATDGVGLKSTTPINVDVTENTPPVLGTYPQTQIAAIGGTGTVIPSSIPSDNGGLTQLTVTSAAFTGTLAINPVTGIVTVSNSGPRGVHTVNVTATDNCGAQTSTHFILLAGATSPLPTVTSLNPTVVPAGANGIQMVVNGSGFAPDAVGLFNNSPRPTQVVSPTQLLVTLTAADLANPGNFAITTDNSPPGGGTSNAVFLSVARGAALTSAATFVGSTVAADSTASIFGSLLAIGIGSAGNTPLPETLAGTTVKVRDVDGVTRNAGLFYVSPGQINLLIPAGTKVGPATAIVTNSDGVVSQASFAVALTSPGVFTASSDANGPPAGYLLRIRADGFRTLEPVARFDTASGKWVTLPIDFVNDTDILFLVVAATGIRHVPGGQVSIEIGGVTLLSQYAGVQPGFEGLDQINVELPRSLKGKGEVDAVVIAEMKRSNTFKLAFR